MGSRDVTLDVLVDPGVVAAEMEVLQRLVAFAAGVEPAIPAGAWTVTLRLTDDERIGDIHKRFFADASPTDVISFPSGDDPSSDTGHLGDIVVSVTTAAENAAEEGHSTGREVAFLLLHGLLHLCGFDDATPADREAMLARQTTILEAFEREEGSSW